MSSSVWHTKLISYICYNSLIFRLVSIQLLILLNNYPKRYELLKLSVNLNAVNTKRWLYLKSLRSGNTGFITFLKQIPNKLWTGENFDLV